MCPFLPIAGNLGSDEHCVMFDGSIPHLPLRKRWARRKAVGTCANLRSLLWFERKPLSGK